MISVTERAKEIGDRQAFPWGGPSNQYKQGMTYKQWLVGQILANSEPGYSMNSFTCGILVGSVDSILRTLAIEELEKNVCNEENNSR